ncbi:hypothetical protein CONPUDRAFT_86138 [Coniophora puteana RWD-64-598 SS2]|uniref:S-adenosyl-L-methionine-dependent methyltransferase n=1 Tax=Coniophora puteana (strain RWD-64-598) TaxID=741705 RepID=A0A5M3N4F4_CONPW|nr:uncharacterized protein CONPUDRAFT_86138 [Coniophora puteana RWD-64-598 SS2]EIW85924.1 hypothetical protein CONPUDRAFT_86138 [Coniophora puteana RWD-64-598 SS2]
MIPVLTALDLPPTSYLPPVKRLVSGDVDPSAILSALDYLYTLYRPEVHGSRRRRQIRQAGPEAELDALEAIRADDFERTYTLRWLTSLIGLAEEEGSIPTPARTPATSPSLTSVLIERAASLLAICAGTASAGTLTRAFTFSSPGGDVSIQLTDIPLINADYTSVGAQTWGGACVLSDLIAERPDAFGLGLNGGGCQGNEGGRSLRVLELGAGTGLVSLTVGKLLELQLPAQQKDYAAELVATDFHPSVLANLGANIDANFSSSSPSSSASVRSCFLDWAAFNTDSTSTLGHEPFDVAFGADIIYEAEHARWIKGCLARLLRRSDPRRPESKAQAPTFHLVIPLRSTHKFESSTVELHFRWDGTARGADHTIEDELVILSKETIVCDAVGGGGRPGRDDADEVVYVYYRIGWES